jgi:nucleoid-associated protein YgaU
VKSKLNLKNILKAIKLNESTISMILGAVIIIVVGVLVVNYFKGKGATTTGQLPENNTGNQVTNEENQTVPGTSYTVAKGDNLWSIAQKTYGSGYNWTDIAQTNNLKNPSTIKVGQVLSLPTVQAKAATSASTVTAQPVSKFNVGTNSEAITGATYQVVKGDCLWKIAVRAYGDGFKWVEIARENKLVHPNLIYSGNILVLPR